MDKSFLLLLLCLLVIFVLVGNAGETFVETFVSNDPKTFINSCNSLIKEKVNVEKLIGTVRCTDGPNPVDFVLPNRALINKKRVCKDLTDKKIMLTSEQPSWCDRVAQADKSALVNPTTFVASEPNVLDGPEYMETQYSKTFGSLAPNDIGSTNYMSFIDATPVSNGYLAPLLV
jgi:hypothetical protein